MKTIAFFTILLTIATFSILIHARQSGITGRTQKGPNPGCTCHSASPAGDIVVNINGPDQMFANDTVAFALTISGGTLNAGGTNIAAAVGELMPTAGLRKASDELTHSAPKAPQAGVVTFEFKYVAPSTPQTDTLYANGLSVGFPNAPNRWNYAPNKILSIDAPTAVTSPAEIINSYRLEQNYPNPFNPSTRITYTLKAPGAPVKLTVYNIQGQAVKNLVNEWQTAGEKQVVWNGTDNLGFQVPSGMYFYQLDAGKFQQTRKMTLMR